MDLARIVAHGRRRDTGAESPRAALARTSEPQLFATLQHPAALPGIAIALTAGIVVIVCVAQRRVQLSRVAVGVEALAILGG